MKVADKVFIVEPLVGGEMLKIVGIAQHLHKLSWGLGSQHADDGEEGDANGGGERERERGVVTMRSSITHLELNLEPGGAGELVDVAGLGAVELMMTGHVDVVLVCAVDSVGAVNGQSWLAMSWFVVSKDVGSS
nr:hypothetical protein CFP56_65236 [Quercus suber]